MVDLIKELDSISDDYQFEHGFTELYYRIRKLLHQEIEKISNNVDNDEFYMKKQYGRIYQDYLIEKE